MVGAKIEAPLRVVLDEQGGRIKCPDCGYDCHRTEGAGAPMPGLDPRMLWLRCGRCEVRFYEVIDVQQN